MYSSSVIREVFAYCCIILGKYCIALQSRCYGELISGAQILHPVLCVNFFLLQRSGITIRFQTFF